jgi:hypothetical protein
MSAEIEIIKYSMSNPVSYHHLLYNFNNLICSPVLFLRMPRFIKKMQTTGITKVIHRIVNIPYVINKLMDSSHLLVKTANVVL